MIWISRGRCALLYIDHCAFTHELFFNRLLERYPSAHGNGPDPHLVIRCLGAVSYSSLVTCTISSIYCCKSCFDGGRRLLPTGYSTAASKVSKLWIPPVARLPACFQGNALVPLSRHCTFPCPACILWEVREGRRVGDTVSCPRFLRGKKLYIWDKESDRTC